jgi:Domain of unknown function (DUF5666)
MNRLWAAIVRHRRVSLAVATVAALGAGATVGYGLSGPSSPAPASAASPPTSTQPAATPSTPPAATPSTPLSIAPAGAPARATTVRRVLRGTITALSATAWTVRTRSGPSITVDVTPATAFGTRAKPAAASSFAIGDQIAVFVSSRQGTTIAAARIAAAPTTTAAG